MSSAPAGHAAPASPSVTAPRLAHVLPLGWQESITRYLREGERQQPERCTAAGARPLPPPTPRARVADAPTFDIGGFVVGEELLEAVLIVKTPG
jgi:hypothetical protein